MGKFSIKHLFTKASKAEILVNLEQNLSDINVELNSLSFICDIVIVILGYMEIDRFKVNLTYFSIFFTMFLKNSLFVFFFKFSKEIVKF